MLVTPLAPWLFAAMPILFVLYWSLWLFYAGTLHPLASIPGPFWASVSRTWYMYRIYMGDSHTAQRRLHEKYGPVVRIAPNEVVTNDPSAIPKIYRNHNALKKTDFYSHKVWNGGGISEQNDNFSERNERKHSSYRRIVNPVYTLSNVLKNEKRIAEVSRLFLQRLGEFADHQQAMDLGEWLQMYTFDVIGDIFFGDKFGFLEHGEDHGGLIRSLDMLMPILTIQAVAPSYICSLILLCAFAIPGILNAALTAHGIGNRATAAVQRRKQDVERGVAHGNDLLQQLFNVVRNKGKMVNFGTNEVTLEAWAAMFAGSDTTAIALRSTFYHLMKNPRTMQKAHEEVDVAIAAGLLGSPVKYSETTTKLPYICAAIKEAMRMHPSVGLSMARHAPDEGIELAGTVIPKGWRVGINPAVVHYDRSVFGGDADEFRPERWLVGEQERRVLEKHVLTFGAGTRTCVGKHISLVEIHTLVPEILRHFDLEMAHIRPWKTSNQWFHKQTDVIVNVSRR